jgi:hypothetical protein
MQGNVNNFTTDHYSDSVLSNHSGTYTFHIPYYVYNRNLACCTGSAPFPVYLQATDTAVSTFVANINAFPGPIVPDGDIAHYLICPATPLSIDLTNSSYTRGQVYDWYLLPSTTPFDTNYQITLNPAQTSSYRLVTSQGFCTIDTVFAVSVDSSPTIGFLDTIKATCPNDSVTIGPAPHPNYGYSWTASFSFNSNDPQITVLPSFSDTYLLTVWDMYGCTSTQAVQVNIKRSPGQTLCMVTVDSTSSHNVLVWEKLNKGATDSFYIYREISTNNYSKIGAVSGGDLSEYHDYGANPNASGYRYKITAKDTCGNESFGSHYHNSIHLQYLGSGNLQWNSYDIENEITPVASYDVYRDSTGTGVWSLILNVSGTQSTATDPNFALYPDAKYRVAANWSYTCTSSRSIFPGVMSNSIKNQVNSVGDIPTGGDIQVVPNPAQNYIDVSIPKSRSGKVTLMDMTGKVISVTQTEGKEIQTLNIEALPIGVYVLLYQDSNVAVSKKVVKE